MLHLHAQTLRLTLLLAVFAGSISASEQEDLEMRGWDTIPAEELAATAPRVDPNAHAEFTYRSIDIDDSGAQTTVFGYHQRAKLYTEEGVKRWDKVDIPYQTGWRISGIRARVVYPDGSVTVLKNRDVYRRRIFKDDRFEGYAKSFSFPGLIPGCIVEYEWKAHRAFWLPSLTIPLQAEWPTWKLDLEITPYRGMACTYRSFHSKAGWEKRRGNLYLIRRNLAAVSDKPLLAARKDFEPWVYIEYAPELKMLEQENYWGYRGGALLEINKEFVKPKKRQIKVLAEELFAGLEDPEAKLKAAYDYCASKLVNIQEYTDKYTEEEIEKLKKNNGVNDTLKNGYGTRYDINAVFASLAAHAGFSAQLAAVENHQVFGYIEQGLGSYNLSDWVVAVAHGEAWRYFDPGSSFLGFEMLNPENAAATTLQTDKKYYYIHKTPEVAASSSVANRLANVSINEFGDLEAAVKIQYNGYTGLWRKRLIATMSEAELKDYIQETEWQARLPRAKITDVATKHADSRDQSLILAYRVEIPGYAEVLPDRMLINPSIFETAKAVQFPDEQRREPLDFSFPYRIEDQIVIAVPEGYALQGDQGADGILESAVIDRKSVAKADEEKGSIIYRRSFLQKATKVGSLYYPVVKSAYDKANAADALPLSVTKPARLASVSNEQ